VDHDNKINHLIVSDERFAGQQNENVNQIRQLNERMERIK